MQWDYAGSLAAAQVLKRKLEAKWRPSTWAVKFRIEEENVNGVPVFGIRSDMIGGLPAGKWKQLQLAIHAAVAVSKTGE